MPLGYLSEFIPMMDTQVCNGTLNLGDWASISALALLTSVFILGFLYLIAVFFQNQQGMALVKLELYEFLVTFMIFVVLFILIGVGCSMRVGWFLPNAEIDHVSIADKSIYYGSSNYLMSFADYTLQMMTLQYYVYVFVDFVTSTELSSVPMGVGATLKPTAGLGAAVKPVLNNAFTAETISVITAEAQVYVMDYGTYGLLKYFLPLALILRSFVYTRRIGGTLIAIICVFLFVYPLLVILSYDTINQSLMSRIDYIKGAFMVPGVFNAMTSFTVLFEFMIKWLWGPDFLMFFALITMPSTAMIFIGGVFLPLFNTVILTNIARSLSRSLGEEVDITNLTRMI